MKRGLLEKLEGLTERLAELSGLLSSQETMSDQNVFRELSKEYAQIQPVVECFQQYNKTLDDIIVAEEMMQEDDPDSKEMGTEELASAQQRQSDLETKLQLLLLPKDPKDENNIFLEVRAGTGGDEAALFSGDLYRMYVRYAESKRWQVEVINTSEGEHGGFKEIICRVIGVGAYSRFKFESGTHRVQRVPTTESQGRIHTSACTVAVLPEPSKTEEIEINMADVRVDTYRASGAGGQHVNKTDSAIRLTHLPSGIVVECQDERSQHKNRARAMSVLQAKLTSAEAEKLASERAESRKTQVGSGDRSERIRTYNFPQGRVTDHRINLTLYKLDELLQGALDPIIDPLTQEQQASLLAELSS